MTGSAPHKQHLRFATATFERVIAHDGARPVWAHRAVEMGESISCRFIDLVIVPAGADIGIHAHDDEAEELYVMISGTGLMHLDGMEFPVSGGDVIVNRPCGTHGLFNPGPEPLRLVVIEVPVTADAVSARGAERAGGEA